MFERVLITLLLQINLITIFRTICVEIIKPIGKVKKLPVKKKTIKKQIHFVKFILFAQMYLR